MERELSVEREAADEKLVKRIKLEKVAMFKKMGHEKQYHHNEEMHIKLSDTLTALSVLPPSMEKVKTLKFRKHINIADRPDNGWAMVEEYVEEDLVDNFDDKKRLSLADAWAGRKLKSASQKNGKMFKKVGPKKQYSSGSWS